LATSVATDVDQHASVVTKCSNDLAAAQNSNAPDRDQQVLNSLSEILKANELLHEQLATAEVQLQRQAAELETQTAVARTDALTSLFNRRALDDELSRRMAEWHRRQSVFGLVMIDVDHFKKFNDVHGHQAGDEVLRGVAAVLVKAMREMDMVARFGGEEFAVVLPMTNLTEGMRAAERVRRAINEAVFHFENTELRVTVSVGVSEVLDIDNVGTLVKRTDAALYSAKKAGRNCVWYHSGDECLPAEAPVKPKVETAAQPAPAPTAVAHPQPAAEASEPSNEPPAATFAADLRRRLAECQQFKVPLSLVFVDIDELPKLVSQWGPTVSEAIFKNLWDLADEVRGDLGFMSRVNTRLAIVIPGADISAAADVGERLREAAVAASPRLRGKEVKYTISVGVAETSGVDSASALSQRADAAVLASKASGKNCTHVHTGVTCKLVANVAAAK
jgi:diguanylate cyclase